jgi:hypothetical protein
VRGVFPFVRNIECIEYCTAIIIIVIILMLFTMIAGSLMLTPKWRDSA